MNRSKGNLMTVAELAERVAMRMESDGEGFSADYYARQIRNQVQLDLIVPRSYRGGGRTAAALFSEEQIPETLIYAACSTWQFTLREMKTIKYLLGNHGRLPLDLDRPGQRIRWRGVATVAERVKMGKRWWLILARAPGMTRDDESGGVMGSFVCDPSDISGHFENPIISGVTTGALVIDCNRLFSDPDAPAVERELEQLKDSKSESVR